MSRFVFYHSFLFLRKMAGFHHLDEFYAVNSSCNYINQVSDKLVLRNEFEDVCMPEVKFV